MRNHTYVHIFWYHNANELLNGNTHGRLQSTILSHLTCENLSGRLIFFPFILWTTSSVLWFTLTKMKYSSWLYLTACNNAMGLVRIFMLFDKFITENTANMCKLFLPPNKKQPQKFITKFVYLPGILSPISKPQMCWFSLYTLAEDRVGALLLPNYELLKLLESL